MSTGRISEVNTAAAALLNEAGLCWPKRRKIVTLTLAQKQGVRTRALFFFFYTSKEQDRVRQTLPLAKVLEYRTNAPVRSAAQTNATIQELTFKYKMLFFYLISIVSLCTVLATKKKPMLQQRYQSAWCATNQW